MAQNTLNVDQDRQTKRRSCHALEPEGSKRFRSEGSMERAEEVIVGRVVLAEPEDNDSEHYVTKAEFSTCIERISRIEERLAKIEKTFECLKFALLGKSNPPSGSGNHLPVNMPCETPPTATTSTQSASRAKPLQERPISSATKSHHGATLPNVNTGKEVPASVAKAVQGLIPSVVSSAQSTPSAAPTSQRTPLSSATPASQRTPVSSAAPASQRTPVSSAAPASQRTPLTSASKSAQETPLSSASKSAQGTPLSSASKSAQGTPLSSASKSAQGTPLSSASKSAQGTPLSSASKSAQGTPLSSASKSAQATPLPLASKSTQITPPSSASKSTHGTPSTSTSKSTHRTPPSSASKSTHGTPSTSTSRSTQGTPLSSASKSAQVTPSSASKSTQGTPFTLPFPTAREATIDIADDEDVTFVESFPINQEPKSQDKRMHANNASTKALINVKSQTKLLAASVSTPTSERNPPAFNQQRARPSVTSSNNSHLRALQPTVSRPNTTFVRGESSAMQAAAGPSNANEACTIQSVMDLMEIPEDAFPFFPLKTEILDTPVDNNAIEPPTNNQMAVYIDGDSRKKKNHDIFAAVAGYKIGYQGKNVLKSYLSDVSHKNMPMRKIAELVKHQAEVTAARLVLKRLSGFKKSCKVKIVARSNKLVQMMQNGILTVYPSFNICQCHKFPCNHAQRWETLDQFTDQLSTDLPHLVVAIFNAGIDIEWCNYSLSDQHIGESFKTDFKKEISTRLKQSPLLGNLSF